MIKVENLNKWFGPNHAVNGVSFNVNKGEVLGFLGPNGAGKSTTMRMITGFIPVDEGSITIGGFDIDEDPIKAKSLMGYLPENAPAYSDMTVTAFLRFIASLRGLSGSDRTIAVEKVIETCFLQAVRHQPIETLSKGFLHRTCFAQSIIHDPEVLILDEPTDGLDPNQKYEVRNLIKRMSERKAIILSTHILEEVDAVCSKVIIINNGKLVADGLPTELKKRSAMADSVIVKLNNAKYDDVSSRLEGIDGVDSVMCLIENEYFCSARVIPKKTGENYQNGLAEKIYHEANDAGWEICELKTDEGRLDDVFRSITTSDVSEGTK